MHEFVCSFYPERLAQALSLMHFRLCLSKQLPAECCCTKASYLPIWDLQDTFKIFEVFVKIIKSRMFCKKTEVKGDLTPVGKVTN